MPILEVDLLRDAQRQLEICNACRYCEGVCAVFPAIERRREFTEGDVSFLAHLCHDCRSCFYVCPYTAPHEFAINIPELMANVRTQTYRHYSGPPAFARILAADGSGLAVILLVSLAVAIGASLIFAGVTALTTPQFGPGAFYKVIPWLWMFLPATLLSLVGAIAVSVGVARYWLDIGSEQRRDGLAGSAVQALGDALTLRYLDGGGPGCDYPDEVPSKKRKLLHHLVFWGFGAAFASTCFAFIYQDVLGILPPYPFLSLPVLFGVGGGIAMIIGGFGLIAVKRHSDRVPASAVMLARDYSFIASLLILSVTGMVLLAFRESAVIGLLLDIHLGCVLAFFLTAPYSKFVHAAYRGAALLHDRLERRSESLSGRT